MPNALTGAPTNSKPEMQTYRVAYGAPGTDTAGLLRQDVEAAYHQNDGEFTTFKDGQNQAVYTIRNNYLISIERGSSLVGRNG
jgi:hypothetical protein